MIVPLVEKDFVLDFLVSPAYCNVSVWYVSLCLFQNTSKNTRLFAKGYLTMNCYLQEGTREILTATILECMSTVESERLATTSVGCNSELEDGEANNSRDGDHGFCLFIGLVSLIV